MNIIEVQKQICAKFGAEYFPLDENLKMGVSESIKQDILPIHGMRFKQENGTCGWYIWAGEYSEDLDFFKPLHISHIDDWNPLVKKYLGLPPGWRFLITPTYEDVWFDDTLV